ncbi:hypothetical protein Xtri_17975 [Xanthomonas campestris pv. trichodesmae]|uniref:Uncharacterized protein n=2 Tax=Xanthomonas citri TaxID=346 RepID=A0AB33CJL0_XANCI|nr:hypothetical protein XcvCFBP7111P_22775 [Xanthomonas citri pv. vignicola]MBZ3921432.1 hypothetical protein [Xanthomonas campestris pv. trichodesmae]MBZ3925364.1 hypothetical protein [Xanthomonas citri pv. sesbaniae]
MGGLAMAKLAEHLRISFLLYGRTAAPMRCSRMLPICAMYTLIDELFWRKKRKNRCVDALFMGFSFACSCPTDECSCCACPIMTIGLIRRSLRDADHVAVLRDMRDEYAPA